MVADCGIIHVGTLRYLMAQDIVLPTIKEFGDGHQVIRNWWPLSNLTMNRAELLEHGIFGGSGHSLPDPLPSLVVTEGDRADPSAV